MPPRRALAISLFRPILHSLGMYTCVTLQRLNGNAKKVKGKLHLVPMPLDDNTIQERISENLTKTSDRRPNIRTNVHIVDLP